MENGIEFLKRNEKCGQYVKCLGGKIYSYKTLYSDVKNFENLLLSKMSKTPFFAKQRMILQINEIMAQLKEKRRIDYYALLLLFFHLEKLGEFMKNVEEPLSDCSFITIFL